jgi:hypothetical protein
MAVYLSLWAVVSVVFWRFAVNPVENPLFVVYVGVLSVAVLTLQASVPLYLGGRYSLWSPVLCLFVVSWVCGYVFLRVGGESGQTFLLFLWGTMLGPAAVAGVAVVGFIELRIRRAVESGTSDGPP